MDAENEKRGEVMSAENGCGKPLETEMFTRGILLNRADLKILLADDEAARVVLFPLLRWYVGLEYEEPSAVLPRALFDSLREKHLHEAEKYKQRLAASANAAKKHSRKKSNELGSGDF